MIALRLVRAHAGLFAALAATVAVAGALAVGVPGYLLGATTAATRTGLADLTGADGAYRVGIRLTGDGAAQDAAVRRIIARETADVPLSVTRTLETDDALPARIPGEGRGDAGAAAVDALVRTDPALPTAARLVDGAWPTRADEAALQADAAERLGVVVGSTLAVGDPDGTPISVTVSALWRAHDAGDPRWAGDPAVRTGRDGAASGPLIVAPSLWNRIDVTPLVRWTIVPDARQAAPASLDALERIDTTLPDALRDSALGSSGVTDDGRLPEGIRGIAQRVTAVLATAPVSAIVLAALAFLALVELARLLVFSRARETLLLRSRGASSARLAGSTAREAAVISVVAAAIGGTVAAVAAGAATGIPVSPVVVILGSAGVATVASAVFAATTWRAAREALTREQVADSGRRRRLASIGIVVLVVAAAVLSSVQFLRDGSPLIVRTDGDADAAVARIDPLAAPAPAFAIVAVALLALALAPLAARVGIRLLDRGPGLGPLLARRLGRGLAGIATGVVLVSLASALLVSTAAYAGTLDRASHDNRALRLGAEVTASGVGAERLRAAAAEIRSPSTLATSTEAAVGDRPVRLVAAPARRLASVSTEGGAADLDALARAVRAPIPGVALPRGAGTLRMTVTARPVPTSSITVRMLTADGVLLVASATPDVDGAASVRVPADATRLVAIDAVLPAGDAPGSDSGSEPVPITARVAFSALRTDRGALDTGPAWSVPFVAPDPQLTTIPYTDLGASAVVDPTVRTTVRLMPSRPPRIPVALTDDIARAAGLRVGSEAVIDDAGASVRVEVSSVVPAIPGAGDRAILADAAALRSAELAGSDGSGSEGLRLWMRGTPSDAARLRAELPSTAIVAGADDDAARGAVISASAGLGIGAVGALLLAAIAVAAVVGADLRARDVDVAVLRALGVDPGRQGRHRVTEHVAVLGWGLAVGIFGGIGISALLVPGLTRAAVADLIPDLPIGLRIDALGLAAGVLALAIALGLILAVAAARVAGRGRTAIVAEAVR